MTRGRHTGMLSVIIATRDSERALVRTLGALVPGATAGLIAEVLIADAGSRDETAAVADIAGCTYLSSGEPLGGRLKKATQATRTPWLLFLQPGTILDAAWIGEARAFIEQPASAHRAATFRRGAPGQPALREALSLLVTALVGRPRPAQGLIISRELYDRLGGHAEQGADPESEFFRRLSRRRTVTLAAAAFQSG
jgi:hypothetical protein